MAVESWQLQELSNRLGILRNELESLRHDHAKAVGAIVVLRDVVAALMKTHQDADSVLAALPQKPKAPSAAQAAGAQEMWEALRTMSSMKSS